MLLLLPKITLGRKTNNMTHFNIVFTKIVFHRLKKLIASSINIFSEIGLEGFGKDAVHYGSCLRVLQENPLAIAES